MEEGKNDNKLKVNTVNEPAVEYGNSSKRRLSVFTSFERAAEAGYEFYRNLTPEQRMNMHYRLSLNAFGELKSNSKGRFSF